MRGDGERFLAELPGFAAFLREPLEVPLQVSSANLRVASLDRGVNVPSIRGEDPANLADQGKESLLASTFVDHEEGQKRRRGRPKPLLLSRLLPTSFVDVLSRCFTNCIADLRMRLRQGFGDFGLGLAHRAESDRNTQYVHDEFLRTSAARHGDCSHQREGTAQAGSRPLDVAIERPGDRQHVSEVADLPVAPGTARVVVVTLHAALPHALRARVTHQRLSALFENS